MASFTFFSLCVVLLFSPAVSQNCTSQKFNNNKLYANCSDLPTLNSYLHYTYNTSNSSLSIAFKAPPAKADGWVAWAVNLNGTGMSGAQALVAFKSSGAVVVKKYNIVSYSDLNETSKLAVDVWDLSAESDSATGDYVIFASVKVPESTEKLNHIWQVGPSVSNGKPDKHAFAAQNLAAKGTLELVASQATAGGGGNTPTGTNSTTTANNNGTSAGYRMKEMNVGYRFGVLVLVSSFFSLW